ncbi:MFS transporter [Soehngenia saccharolytica]|nr:MFS transporter [Soehngenia saccharolytica]
MFIALVFVCVFIIQFIIALEMNFIGPLAPFLSSFFGIKGSNVILLNLGYSLSGMFVPIIGYLSDKYGKKRFILSGLMFFILGSVICGFSSNAILFSIGRVLIGISYFTLMSTMLSYLSDFINYENRGKANGIMRFSFALAILTSPVYASFIVNKYNNLKFVYYPLALIAIIPFITLIFLPDSRKMSTPNVQLRNIFDIAKKPKNLQILTSLFLIITAPTLIYNYLGLHLSTNFSFNQSKIGSFYSLIAIGTILGVISSAIFSDKVGNLNYSKLFFCLVIISLLPIGFTNNLLILAIASFVFALGLDGGFSAFQTYITEVEKEMRGTFLSLMYTVNALTITFYSLTASKIYEFGGMKIVSIISFVFIVVSLYLIHNLDNIKQD